MLNKKHDPFNFIQHNIKKIELYDTELSINKKIITKRTNYRDLESYLKNNHGYDLYTLQEVQNNKKENSGSIKISNINYKFVYNPIGSKDYYYLNEDKKSSTDTIEKEYGCMVVFNRDRFDEIDIYKLKEFKELKRNASPLVYLQDKKTQEHFLVLSLQGYEPTLKNIKKIKKLNIALSILIEHYTNKFKELGITINFIIGCDLKYNILKPKIINQKTSSKKKSKTNKSSTLKTLQKSITKLINTILKFKINYDLDKNINTVYSEEKGNSYQDCNDYIFKSKFLETHSIKYGCNFIGTTPSINNNLVENFNDFEHKYIFCIIGLNRKYK